MTKWGTTSDQSGAGTGGIQSMEGSSSKRKEHNLVSFVVGNLWQVLQTRAAFGDQAVIWTLFDPSPGHVLLFERLGALDRRCTTKSPPYCTRSPMSPRPSAQRAPGELHLLNPQHRAEGWGDPRSFGSFSTLDHEADLYLLMTNLRVCRAQWLSKQFHWQPRKDNPSCRQEMC